MFGASSELASVMEIGFYHATFTRSGHGTVYNTVSHLSAETVGKDFYEHPL